MDLRAGSPAAERRTWTRSLRGPILAGPASSCAHDDDRLRFPPASPARNSKAGKKESTGRRLNRPCQPCARPSSNSSLGYHRNNARTAENGFATSSAVSKSAKVVLVFRIKSRHADAIAPDWRHRVSQLYAEHSHAGHSHPGHSHVHAPANFGRVFAIAALLNISLVVIQVVYGVLAHSVALLADAGHNFGDVVGLLLAWGAHGLCGRSPFRRFTYGFGSASVLAALLHAIILLVATGAIAWEAVHRFFMPAEVAGVTV